MLNKAEKEKCRRTTDAREIWKGDEFLEIQQKSVKNTTIWKALDESKQSQLRAERCGGRVKAAWLGDWNWIGHDSEQEKKKKEKNNKKKTHKIVTNASKTTRTAKTMRWQPTMLEALSAQDKALSGQQLSGSGNFKLHTCCAKKKKHVWTSTCGVYKTWGEKLKLQNI